MEKYAEFYEFCEKQFVKMSEKCLVSFWSAKWLIVHLSQEGDLAQARPRPAYTHVDPATGRLCISVAWLSAKATPFTKGSLLRAARGLQALRRLRKASLESWGVTEWNGPVVQIQN